MREWLIQTNLLIKAQSPAEAEAIARTRLTMLLNNWFMEDQTQLSTQGSLMLWSIKQPFDIKEGDAPSPG